MTKIVTRKRYFDVKTTNTSFIKTCNILKNAGVKNYRFPLTIYDTDLVGVDPYDPNLSTEMKVKILQEVRQNFWYFIREVARIPVSGGVNVYGLHRGNLALSWCLVNNISSIIELPRQNGKSISVCVFYLWLYNFATVNSELMLMNKKYDDSQMNLKRIKEMREALPEYLRLIDNKNDKNNTIVLSSAITKNTLVAKPAATDAVTADGLGRGCTQPCQWLMYASYIS